MLIYVVRHGETDWNSAGRLQGQQDIPLNDNGRRQADRNGRTLKRILADEVARFDFVSSPLERARETMERVRLAIGLTQDQYRIDERLKELSFGDWEGSTLAELDTISPQRVIERERNKWDFQPPGAHAESYEILSWRVAAWLRSVEQPTIAVCHGGVIRCLHHLVTGLEGDEAAILDVPQDRVLRLDDGQLGWL